MEKFTSITRINVEEMAHNATAFPQMMFPNEQMEIQCRRMFKKGAEYLKNELILILKDYFNQVTPCTTEENSEIKVEDKSLWNLYNALLAHKIKL